MLTQRHKAIITSVQDGMILRSPRPEDKPLQKFKVAWQDFVERWQSAPPRPANRQLRHFDAIVTLLGIAAILIVALYVDEGVAKWAQTFSPIVVSISLVVTQFGLSGYIFVISAVVLVTAVLARRGRSARVDAGLVCVADRATFVIALNAVAGIGADILKFVFGRTRPHEMNIVGPFDFNVFSLHARQASFPSGHAVTVFATALALTWMVPRLRLPLFVFATLIGFSRIALADHYASDVLAGIFIGVGTAILMRRAFARRGIAFRNSDAGILLRGRGIAWPAVVASVRGSRPT